MKRLKHRETGAIVEVPDKAGMPEEWEPVDALEQHQASPHDLYAQGMGADSWEELTDEQREAYAGQATQDDEREDQQDDGESHG